VSEDNIPERNFLKDVAQVFALAGIAALSLAVWAKGFSGDAKFKATVQEAQTRCAQQPDDGRLAACAAAVFNEASRDVFVPAGAMNLVHFPVGDKPVDLFAQTQVDRKDVGGDMKPFCWLKYEPMR
jgi:hypothetical protein